MTAYKLYKLYKYEWGPHQTSSTFIQTDKHIIQFGHIYNKRHIKYFKYLVEVLQVIFLAQSLCTEYEQFD